MVHNGVNSSVTSGKQLNLLTFKEIGSMSVMWNLVKLVDVLRDENF